MKFKAPELQQQFNELPEALQKIGLHFDELSQEFGIESVVTRVWDPVPGDSGVHEEHRAIDFRDEVLLPDGAVKNLYTPEQAISITTTLNNLYPREDGKVVCMFHSFQGGPMHAHIQIPSTWVKGT